MVMRHLFKRLQQIDERVPIGIKLTGLLLLVILVGVATAYPLARREAQAAFKELSFTVGTTHLRMMEDSLASYYATRGSWAGVERLLTSPMFTISGFHEVVLTDTTGTIVATPEAALLGERLSPEELAFGVPITVGGAPVGVALAGTALDRYSASQRAFFTATSGAVLKAGLAAALVALILGFLVMQRITRPIGALARGTERIAAGEFQQQVHWAASDPLGRLAASFNRMSERLAHSEELRRQMIADIAHELRNPLAVLKADLQAMVDGIYPLDREQLASLQEETELLERLVEDLRTLSMADAGELPLQREAVELGGLLRRVANRTATDLAARDVTLEVALPEEPVLVSVDSQRIQQVLINLLRNARQHTPEGGRVTITMRRREADVEVRVADTGPGIAPEDAPYVFERFWRADRSRARATGGSGLGLAIARKLVEAHGGRIWVDVEAPGPVATVAFSLPAA